MNLKDIENFEKIITLKLNSLLSDGKVLKSSLKEDETLVTELDLFVSKLIKDHYQNRDYNFYSEEDFGELKFPSIILDPIDGTKELNSGIGECAVSLAIMNSNLISDSMNNAWIYNPFTGFSISTLNFFTRAMSTYSGKLQTLVSRSEWKKGNYLKSNFDKFHIAPRGSVAFKLGLLSAGACDFIISKEEKKIWDIAAGCILSNRRGYNFYEDGTLVTKLDKELYCPPLVWCREVDFVSIHSSFDS